MAAFLSDESDLAKLASLLTDSSVEGLPGWWRSVEALDRSLDPNKLPLAVYFGFVLGEVCRLVDVNPAMY